MFCTKEGKHTTSLRELTIMYLKIQKTQQMCWCGAELEAQEDTLVVFRMRSCAQLL